MKSVPEATTRLAMLKQQEADVAYGIFGSLAEEVRRDPHLKLEISLGQTTHWVSFVDQYDSKSPWADKRVRLAANHAVHWPAINDAEMLGYAFLTGGIIPHTFAYALQLEPHGYDPKKARQLLKDAGYANGFDAGECSTDMVYATLVEAVVNDLAAVDIRATVRSMERATMLSAHKEKTVKNLTRQASAAFGNAATRVEAFMYSQGGSRFCVTPTLMPGIRSRRRSATARNARPSCTRFSRKHTTTCALCRSGSPHSGVPQGHGWRCPGSICARLPTLRPMRMYN